LAEDALRVHLIILFLSNFKDKLEVLLREAICTELRPSLFLVLASDHHVLLHLLAQGDFLLHLTNTISVVGVLGIDSLEVKETRG